MNAKYQGKSIRAQREARDGDKGFVKGDVDQVVITLEDGTEKTVKKSELVTVSTDQPDAQPKR